MKPANPSPIEPNTTQSDTKPLRKRFSNQNPYVLRILKCKPIRISSSRDLRSRFLSTIRVKTRLTFDLELKTVITLQNTRFGGEDNGDSCDKNDGMRRVVY